MARERKGTRNQPLRAYDRASGEYRVVARREGADFAAAAQYRAECRRKHRKHVLIFFYLFMFLLVLSAAAALSLTVLFKISDIDVTGSSHYSRQQIIEESGIKKGDNLFLTKTEQSSERIREKLPYLGTVAVKRKFPAKIEISVQEDTVYGAAAFGKKYVIIGGGGNALDLVNSIPNGCTELQGLEVKYAQAGKLVQYKDAGSENVLKTVMEALQKNGLSNITAVDFSKSYRIMAVYDNRIRINFGIPSDLDYKMKFVKSLLKNNIKSTDRGTLNMSVASDTNKAYFDPNYDTASTAD